MTSGWFAFGVVACIVVACGFVLAMALLRAAWAQKERESLSSDDLRVLEESAFLLIEQLKAETDSRVSALEDYAKRIDGLLREADLRIASLQKLVDAQTNSPSAISLDSNSGLRKDSLDEASYERVANMLSNDMECADVARNLGLGCAEVKLIRRLASLKN
jgi:hypothetical protein